MYIYCKGGQISEEIIFIGPIFKQWQNCPDLSNLNFGTLSKFVFDLILKEKKPFSSGEVECKMQNFNISHIIQNTKQLFSWFVWKWDKI